MPTDDQTSSDLVAIKDELKKNQQDSDISDVKNEIGPKVNAFGEKLFKKLEEKIKRKS